MISFRTALGIDISDGRINLALLGKDANGVKLLKAASGPVPDGAIKNGNIEDPKALTKAIKKLKAKNRIHSHRTSLSLVANPTLMQILDLPKDSRGNIRQFVHEQVKHYAMLPINKAAVDFCGIKASAKSGSRRALVVATDGQKVTAAARTMNREGLNVDAIEPHWMAYTRACYAKKITKSFDTNLLFATVYNGSVTLYLFKNQTLDFIRTKPIVSDILRSEKFFEWLMEEINAVIKFYELEVSGKCNKWQVTLVADICDKSVDEKTKLLRAKFNSSVELEVRTPENAYLDTAVAEANYENKPSAVAVGLAMKLLNVPGCPLSINLLPAELARAKLVEKQVLIIANLAAVTIFLIILSISFLNKKVERVNADIQRSRQAQVSQNTPALLNERTLLQGQIADMSEKLDLMNNAMSTGSVLEWDQILTDIKLATPKTVRITGLSSSDNSKMLLDGRALSYEAIYLFVDTLNTCKNIESASLDEIGMRSGSGSFVRYSISCSLTQ